MQKLKQFGANKIHVKPPKICDKTVMLSPSMCCSRKYLYPPPQQRVFWFEPPHPSGNSSLASYFPLKFLVLNTPLPLRISNDPPLGGYGYFLEPHN